MTPDHTAAAFYSRWARVYELVAERTPGVAGIRREASVLLRPGTGSDVVEIGCGTGPNFPFLREAVGEEGSVVGIDIAPGALARAQQKLLRHGWEQVHVVCADGTQPPLRQTDAIFGSFVTGMFENPATVIDRWCDIVGPGGRIGLLDFLPSRRSYAPIPNLVLRAILFLSAPGRTRLRGDMMARLDERVRLANDVLRERCDDREMVTHWGGIVRIHVGTVRPDSGDR